jgi:hypothetical protein
MQMIILRKNFLLRSKFMADESSFRFGDSSLPAIKEGTYSAIMTQNVKFDGADADSFSVQKSFKIAANNERLSDTDIFSVYPPENAQGNFSGTLPFIVFNNEQYPWIKEFSDTGGNRSPWLVLIVVSEAEISSGEAVETDVKYSEISSLSEPGVYFPFTPSGYAKADDNIHILTISKKLFNGIFPDKDDLRWLSGLKVTDLSNAEDSLTELDGRFSYIVSNRFVPGIPGQKLKSGVFLVSAVDYYDEKSIENCDRIRFVSIKNFNIYNEADTDKSFVTLTTGLSQNSCEIKDSTLKKHFLRSGETAYSLFSSPLINFTSDSPRNSEINGEERFTSDGRMIYKKDIGIFDISYAAAFNLGKLITLSRRSDAEKIVTWRRNEQKNRHIAALDSAIRTPDVATLITKLTSEGLK